MEKIYLFSEIHASGGGGIIHIHIYTCCKEKGFNGVGSLIEKMKANTENIRNFMYAFNIRSAKIYIYL